MPHDESYTTEEVASLLKISKLKVYDLIKKGELPSYRVGKQMRVDASDLEAYKRMSRGGAGLAAPAPAASATAASAPAAAALTPAPRPSAEAPAPDRRLVITGQDSCLDLLAKHLDRPGGGLRPLRSYAGSLDSLIAMYRGEADIVSTHLLDGDSGEYNLPYIRKILSGFPYIVVHLVARTAGLYVAKGNPKRIRGWADLGRDDLRIVNREIGSGARVLLDEQLRRHGIRPGRVRGYDQVQTNHLAVAGKVAGGEADVGVGIEKAANFVGTVEFIPLIQESLDLVMLRKPENESWIAAVLNILKSDAYQSELRSLHGYDLSRTGTVLYENEG